MALNKITQYFSKVNPRRHQLNIQGDFMNLEEKIDEAKADEDLRVQEILLASGLAKSSQDKQKEKRKERIERQKRQVDEVVDLEIDQEESDKDEEDGDEDEENVEEIIEGLVERTILDRNGGYIFDVKAKTWKKRLGNDKTLFFEANLISKLPIYS